MEPILLAPVWICTSLYTQLITLHLYWVSEDEISMACHNTHTGRSARWFVVFLIWRMSSDYSVCIAASSKGLPSRGPACRSIWIMEDLTSCSRTLPVSGPEHWSSIWWPWSFNVSVIPESGLKHVHCISLFVSKLFKRLQGYSVWF